MTAIALISVTNHYHINGLHLLRGTLYMRWFIFSCEFVAFSELLLLLLLLLLFTPLEFFTSMLTDGFSLEFEWQQVSRTRLRILAVLSNAVVWIVSVRPPISKSSRPFNNPLVIVPNAPITIGTIVTFMFHSFFNSLARSRYLSFFSLSFRFILWSTGTAKSTILQIFFFFCWLLWSLIFCLGLGDPFVC